MTAVCPTNPHHDQFYTVAHIAETWIVDKHGNFIVDGKNCDRVTLYGPHPDNVWTCAVCGEIAKVTS